MLTNETLARAKGLRGQGDNNDFITSLRPQPTVAWKNLTPAHRLQILATIDNIKNTNSPCQ